MPNTLSSRVLRSPQRPRTYLLATLLAATAAACGDEPAADPSTSPPILASADKELTDAAAQTQEQVDALLLAASNLDDLLAAAGARGQLDERGARLTSILDELATAAQAVRASRGDASSATELSRRAGQVVPLLRRLKVAVRDGALTAEQQRAVLAAAARVRWAAVQLNRSAGRYQSLLGADGLPRAAEGSARRNGPLYPGSAYWVLDQGHIDPVDAAFEDGELELSIHDETTVPDVEREHEHTIMVVKRAAKTTVPDARFSFIGPVGSPFWLLPEAQLDAEAAGILWPGLAAEEIEPGVFVDDAVHFRFKQVIGPNGLSLFFSPPDETTAPEVRVDSENGMPDTLVVPAGSHQHLNWAFESAGIYLVKADVRGQLDVPGAPWVTSATETLVFVVLP